MALRTSLINQLVFSKLREQLLRPSRRDIKLGPSALDHVLVGNEFRNFFEILSNAVATGLAEDEDDEIEDESNEEGVTDDDEEMDESNDQDESNDEGAAGDNEKMDECSDEDEEIEGEESDTNTSSATGSSSENQQEIYSEAALVEFFKVTVRIEKSFLNSHSYLEV